MKETKECITIHNHLSMVFDQRDHNRKQHNWGWYYGTEKSQKEEWNPLEAWLRMAYFQHYSSYSSSSNFSYSSSSYYHCIGSRRKVWTSWNRVLGNETRECLKPQSSVGIREMKKNKKTRQWDREERIRTKCSRSWNPLKRVFSSRVVMMGFVCSMRERWEVA